MHTFSTVCSSSAVTAGFPTEMTVQFASPVLSVLVTCDPSAIPFVPIVGRKSFLIFAWVLGQVNAKVLGKETAWISTASRHRHGFRKGARVPDKATQSIGAMFIFFTVSFTKVALATESSALPRKGEGRHVMVYVKDIGL